MPRGRPKSSKPNTRPLKVIDRKPIRPLERQKMRPWLLEMLDRGDCQQLAWYNKKDKLFRVTWKHAAGQTFDPTADATLFERWATHTGKFYKGDFPDPKKWKANFRCALHSLPDVFEDKGLGVKKGNNAYRVYRFLDEKLAKKKSVKLEKDDKTDTYDSEDDVINTIKTIGTRSRLVTTVELDSEGSEVESSPSHDSSSSEWEMPMEMEESTPQVSPLPHFEQFCEYAFGSGSVVTPVPETPVTIEEQEQDIEVTEAVENIIQLNYENLEQVKIYSEDDSVYYETGGQYVVEPNVIVIEESRPDFEGSYTCLDNVW